MLKNYLKIAFRNLRRQPGYTAINVVGLAVGMAACLLIGLYVRHELSYDAFHEKGDRIYRVVEKFAFRPEDVRWDVSATGLLAPELRASHPDVVEAVRMKAMSLDPVRVGYEAVEGLDSYAAESSIFDVFSFDLLRGDPGTALNRPGTVVLTESLARRMFGRTNPVGQTLSAQLMDSLRTFEVTGVMADVPSNSHLAFDLLFSFDTLLSTRLSIGSNQFLTYVLLREDHAPVEALELLAYNTEKLENDYVKEVRLQPLGEVYFGEVFAPKQGDLRYVYVFSAVALIILLIACANYMNLSTARSGRRAREVGVRKAMGAQRTQLAGQFLGESLLLSLVALVLALALLRLALPAFNAVAGTEVAFGPRGEADLLLLLVGLAVGVGLLAGSYPALFLSRYRPVEVLRDRLPAGWSGVGLRKTLIVFQFALSAALIFCTAVVLQQLYYVQHERLGFDQEHVVTVPTRSSDAAQRAGPLKEEVRRLPGVQHAAFSIGAPTTGGFGRSGFVFDWKEGQIRMQRAFVDADFLKTLGIRLVAGRAIAPEHVERAPEVPWGHGAKHVLLNETAVQALGWSSSEDAVGRTIEPFSEKTVIGVVEDFHFRSLHHRIEPLALEPAKYRSTLVVRLASGDVPETLEHLQQAWAQFAPDLPFSYHFLDEQIEQLYRQEQRTAKIFVGFAALALFLACLGLFGLTAFTAEQRTKEIGIRKVLGASIGSIVALLSKDFARLVAVAFVVAAPVAWWAMSRWLEDFAYRIDLSPWLFVAAGAAALGIALLTVSTQALRAATANPTDALRSE